MDCWIVYQLLALLNSILLSAAYRHLHVHTSADSCEQHGPHAQPRIDPYSSGERYPDSGHGHALPRMDSYSSGERYPDSGHGHALPRMDSYSSGERYPDSGHGHAQPRMDSHSDDSYPDSGSSEEVGGRSNTDRRVMNRRGADGGENGTKIVSIADRLQIGDPDKIVFPTSDSFVPNVPEECKKTGICEEVPEYPDNHVKQLVQQLGNAREQFKIDELLVPVSIASRNGGPGEEKPCRAFEKVAIPRAAPDKDGTWRYIVNQREALQGVRVEICHSRNTEEDLARFVYPNSGYKLGCKQEYMIRHLYTLDHRGQMVLTAMQLPSCCAFVASADENLRR